MYERAFNEDLSYDTGFINDYVVYILLIGYKDYRNEYFLRNRYLSG